MEQKIEQIIIETLCDLNDELSKEELKNPNKNTNLFGANGALDSLSLVLFVTNLEEKISEYFKQNILLADEKAMSQRVSPFRDVESLTEYIKKLLDV